MNVGSAHVLRPLAVTDAERTLNWRNQSGVRNSMFNPSPVAAENHIKWINAVIDDPDRAYFVYEQDDVPLGLVGIIFHDRAIGEAEWSFYIGSASAPRGSGMCMLWLALTHFFDRLAGTTLLAEVLEDNTASLRLHDKLGFGRNGVRTEKVLHLGVQKYVHLFEIEAARWRLSPRPAGLPMEQGRT